MHTYLEFEKPIAELEGKARELRRLASAEGPGIEDEAAKLEARAHALLRETYARLTPWQKTLVARHPNRPHFTDYTSRLIEDFTPLAGDRRFGEDRAIIAGIGRFNGRAISVIGNERGGDTQSRIRHNFGMARPEGFRKAVRIMQLAQHFNLPVLTLIDTAGAYPGVGAEERGQAEAIARSTEACLNLRVPLISVIIGEGGSGGAVALATADKVLMLEHSVYSVISPEGCASIVWRSAEKAEEAAAALKITAQDLHAMQIIDVIVAEPVGGAHREPQTTIAETGKAIERALRELGNLDGESLRERRRERYLRIGRDGLG